MSDNGTFKCPREKCDGKLEETLVDSFKHHAIHYYACDECPDISYRCEMYNIPETFKEQQKSIIFLESLK